MLLPMKMKDFEDDENDADKFKDPDKGASVNDVDNVSVIEDRQKTHRNLLLQNQIWLRLTHRLQALLSPMV